MITDFSRLERIFTDRRMSGMYKAHLSEQGLDHIKQFAYTNKLRVFDLDNTRISSMGEVVHIISEILGYIEVYHHDAVWDGFTEYMDEDFDQLYKEKGFETNGTIIIFRGIHRIFMKATPHIPIMLDVFHQVTLTRAETNPPIYLLFVVRENETLDLELQAQFDKYGVKPLG